MELKEMSIEQLKALAYDQVVQLNQCQMNVRAIEQEIASRKQAVEKVEK